MKGQRWILFGVGLIVALIYASFLSVRPSSVLLLDGTKVRFGGVSYGTNAYMHGNAFEKLLAPWIPEKGWDLGAIKLQKPRPVYSINDRHRLDPLGSRLYRGQSSTEIKDPVLWFLFQSPTNWPANSMGVIQDCRVVAISEGGAEFPNRFSGVVRRPDMAEMLVSASLKFFPRTEKKLKLRLENRDQSGQWQIMADYVIVNPALVTNENWKISQSTLLHTNFIGDFDLILTKASVGDASASKKGIAVEALQRLRTPYGPFDSSLQLEFLLKMNESSLVDDMNLGRNWQIRKLLTRDRFGNELNWESSGREASISPGRPYTLRTLGNALPNEMRKVEVTVAPKGLALSPAAAVTFTNLVKPFGSIGEVREFCLTNALGVPILARWSAEGLEIRLPDSINDGLLATAKISCDVCSESTEKGSRDERRIIFNRVSDERVNVEVRAVRLVKLNFFVKPVVAE